MILFRSLIFILLIFNTFLIAQEDDEQYNGIANQLSLTFSDLIWKYEPELIEQNLKSSVINHQLSAIILYDKGLKEYQAAWKDNNSILYQKSDKPIKIAKEQSSDTIIKKMKKDQQELGKLTIYYKKSVGEKIPFTEEEKAYIKSHSKLKVSNEQKWAPFNFNENGEAKGFSIDYFELIAKKAGFEVNYIIGPTWKEFTDRLKEKKLDVLLNVAYNEERTKWMEFTDNKYFQVHYGLAINSSNSDIQEFKDILDKTVAIEKGFWLHKWLEKNHPQVNIKTYPNTLEALRAISLNEADVYVGNISVAGYLIKNNWLTNVDIKPLGKTKLKKTNDLYIGFQKGNLILKNIIDKTMQKVSNEEINRLHSKWFNKPENQDKKISLTEEELLFIKQNPIIKVSNTINEPPYSFLANEKPTGYVIDNIKMLAKKAGLKIQFVQDTWNPLVEKFKNKELDVMPMFMRNNERKKYTIFTDNFVYQASISVVAHRDKSLKNANEFNNKKVAMVQGWASTKAAIKQYPKIHFIELSSAEECLENVRIGKVDGAFLPTGMASYFTQKLGLVDLGIKDQVNLKSTRDPKAYIGIRNDWPELASILDKAVEAVTLKERAALNEKWYGTFNTKELPTLDLTNEEIRYLDTKDSLKICVDPNWLPFEKIDDQGNYKGIGSYVMKIVSDKLNKSIDLVPTTSWAQTIERFLDKKCDILPVASSTPNRQKIMNFTQPYIKKSLVVATKQDQFFIQDSSELKGKKIGLVEDYAFIELLKQIHPDIKIITVKNIKEGLKKVQTKELFGFVDALPSIGYII